MDGVYLLQVEGAEKPVEPPRLAKLMIYPEKPTIKPKDKLKFRPEGLDQHAMATNFRNGYERDWRLH